LSGRKGKGLSTNGKKAAKEGWGGGVGGQRTDRKENELGKKTKGGRGGGHPHGQEGGKKKSQGLRAAPDGSSGDNIHKAVQVGGLHIRENRRDTH